jgi:SAM-dependent methyltransferase
VSVASHTAVWHDLECGGYVADLSLWRGLADRRPGPILEVGAGTGRVALELAGYGHDVTALDRDEVLLAELSRRAQARSLSVRTALADARDFELAEEYVLIAVPMQTVQLLGGASGRGRFLSCAAAHLVSGGRLAMAITERFQLYDAADLDGLALPPPDMRVLAEAVFLSHPTAVRREGETIALERRRETICPDGSRRAEHDRIVLDKLSAAGLEREGRRAGLRPAGRIEVPSTEDHVGSLVVMLDA